MPTIRKKKKTIACEEVPVELVKQLANDGIMASLFRKIWGSINETIGGASRKRFLSEIVYCNERFGRKCDETAKNCSDVRAFNWSKEAVALRIQSPTEIQLLIT